MSSSKPFEFAQANPIADITETIEALTANIYLSTAASLALSAAERTKGLLGDEVALVSRRCDQLFGRNVLLHTSEAYTLHVFEGQKLWYPRHPNSENGIRISGCLRDLKVFDRFQAQGGDGSVDETNRLAVCLQLSPNVLEHADFEVPNITYVPANKITHSEVLESQALPVQTQ